MAGAGPLTSAELAAKTQTTERYVREWLSAQAAGGFVKYDAATENSLFPPNRRWRWRMSTAPFSFPDFSRWWVRA